jgi:hypothetical protein
LQPPLEEAAVVVVSRAVDVPAVTGVVAVAVAGL